MQLRKIAHSRTGDKGNTVTISLIAYRPEDYSLLEEHVTAEQVSAFFAEMIDPPAVRYTLPQLSALNFVLQRPETQSVTRSLALDAHGKCLGSALLAMEIQLDESKVQPKQDSKNEQDVPQPLVGDARAGR
jgi:hypothetical protein